MDENNITKRDRILWFFIGAAITLLYHYFFPLEQEPAVQPEPTSVEQTVPAPEQKQERPSLFQYIFNGEAVRLSRKVYQDDEGIVYQVVHDNYQFFRGFFFKPTTDPVPTWYPVEELPWQVSAEAAQADLDKMAERKHWKPMKSDHVFGMMMNIHSKEENP